MLRFLNPFFSLVLTLLVGGTLCGSSPACCAATVENDIAYVAGAADSQKLDFYLPDKKGFTTVVFTYGGGWHTGSRKSVAPVGRMFQKLGFGCVLLSHRLGPEYKFPAQVEDLAAAFAWVKAHVAERGGDSHRLFLVGHSSGAHLSVLLATDPKYLARYKLTPAAIRGVIGLSTPVDLEPTKTTMGMGDVLMAGHGADTFSRDAQVMKDASPLQHVTAALPPTLLIVGDKDFPMLEGDAKRFVKAARAVHVSVELEIAANRDHMGTVRGLTEEDSPLLKRVLSFLKKASP